MVDLAASQQILSWLEAKFAVKNLFGKQRMLTTGDTQVPFSRWEYGTAYSLSVSMNLQ
jgi:outer membrane receptor protein involved in Fe transport